MRSRWWLAALLGLLLGIVWHAPAAWMARAVALATAERLVLADAEGTVWSGRAHLVLTGGAGASEALALAAPLEWRWIGTTAPWGVALELRHAQALPTPLRLQLARWPQGWGLQLSNPNGQGPARAEVPAGVLAGLGAPWNSIQPRGRITLQVDRLQWHPLAASDIPALSAALVLQVHQAASRLSTLPVLGSYRLSVSSDGPRWDLALDSSVDSPLQLQGSGQWSPGTRLQFQGIASALPASEAALGNLLNILGRRDGSRSVITL